MRPAPFKCIIEASSEDNVHKAENLLHLQAGKKWKTKLIGEKSAFVIIELREPVNITGIDIGNEHSAFVEVFAAKSGNTRNEFLEVLTTCSFMTPIESKNSTTTNRVRCFGKNSLVESSVNIKFQVIKVVCSQPFNKFVQYGLAFIKIYTESDQKNNENLDVEEILNREGNTQFFGKFSIRNDSTDSENEKSESIFQRWKNERKSSPEKRYPKAALSSEQIEASLSKQVPRNHKKKGDHGLEAISSRHEHVLDGNGHKQLTNSKTNADQPSVKRKKLKNAGGEKVIRESKTNTDHLRNIEPEAGSANDRIVGKSTPHSDSESPRKRKSSLNNKPMDKTAFKNIRFRPFNQLLKGSVIVISGIQNPDRADLRSKALAMGAVYKSDWNDSCTHLVCAFKNTPKYCQVVGKGKIVTRNWIESCYNSRKYLPWRRFALDGAELANSESDEEIWEEGQRVPEYRSPEKKHQGKVERSNTFSSENGLKDYSGNDTDDEIQAVIQSRSRQKNELKEKISPTINTKQNICDTSAEDFSSFVAQDSRKEIASDEAMNIREDNNRRESKIRKSQHRRNVNRNSKESFNKESVYEVSTEEEDFLSLKDSMRNRTTERTNVEQISTD